MPIYEYECQDCRTRFEKLERSALGAEKPSCPGCGSKSVEKLISKSSTLSGGGASLPVSAAPS